MAFQKNQNFLKKFLQKLGQVVVVLLSVYEILITKKRSFFAHGSTSLLEVILILKVQKNKIDLLLQVDMRFHAKKRKKKLNRLIGEVDRRTCAVRWRHDPSVFKSMFSYFDFSLGRNSFWSFAKTLF